jgi:putative ABC transport system permease protein
LAGISQAEDAVSALQYQISQTTDEETLAVLNAQLEQAQQKLDELNATYDSAKAQLEESESRLSESKALFEQKKSEGQAQLDYAYSQISSGRTQLDAAKAELAQQSADGQAQLDSAESKLNDAQSEYDSGVAKLAEEKKNGEKKLSDAQTEYDDGVKKADEEFKKAEDKIKDAEEEINSLTEPKWYVFDRSDNPGYSTFSSNADRLGAVATVFPVFFLLVAVLVCVTTMTRLIEEKRTEIGTLKALGYSNTSIIMKFVIYSLLAAVIGSVIGILIGIFTLPFVIYDAYKIMYYIGDITLIPDYTSIIFGIVAAVVCTVVVSAHLWYGFDGSRPI